jgi:hypothetical protein
MSSSPEVMSLIEPLMLNFCWAIDHIGDIRLMNRSILFNVGILKFKLAWQTSGLFLRDDRKVW